MSHVILLIGEHKISLLHEALMVGKQQGCIVVMPPACSEMTLADALTARSQAREERKQALLEFVVSAPAPTDWWNDIDWTAAVAKLAAHRKHRAASLVTPAYRPRPPRSLATERRCADQRARQRSGLPLERAWRRQGREG
jgi:hypothetical protein